VLALLRQPRPDVTAARRLAQRRQVADDSQVRDELRRGGNQLTPPRTYEAISPPPRAALAAPRPPRPPGGAGPPAPPPPGARARGSGRWPAACSTPGRAARAGGGGPAASAGTRAACRPASRPPATPRSWCWWPRPTRRG